MKRNFLNLKRFLKVFVLGLMAVATATTFVSCHDDDSESRQLTDTDITQLIDEKIAAINAAIEGLKQADQDLNAADQADLAKALQAVNDAKAALEAADAANLNEVKTLIANAQTAAQNKASEELAAAKTALEAAIAAGDQKNTDEVNAAITKAANELAAAKTEIAAAYEAADERVLAAAKAEVANAKKILEDALEEAKTKLSNDIVALDAKLTAAVAKAQGAAEAAQATADANTKAIAKVADDLATTNTKLGTLTDDVRAAETRIGTLETALAGQIAALQQEIQDRKDAVNGEKSAREAADQALDEKYTEKINTLTTNLNTLKTNLEAADALLNTAIETLTTNVNERFTQTNSDLTSLRNDYDQTKTLVTEKITGINTQIETINTTLEAQATEISTINGKLDVISGILSKNLRSLVFMPYLYVDGIESIMYPYFTWKALTPSIASTAARPERFGTLNPEEGDAQITLPKDADYTEEIVTPVTKFGPYITVDYHMNPSTAATKWEDIVGFVQRNTDYITRATTPVVEPLEKNPDNEKEVYFKNANGILTVGMKVNDVDQILGAGKNYIVALQAKSGDNEESVITSDYALLHGVNMNVEGIAWTKPTTNFERNDRRAADGASMPDPWDEACSRDAAKKNHVFDDPREAIAALPSIEIAYTDTKGIALGEYLETHLVQTQLNGSTKDVVLPFGGEKKYGLHYEFNNVRYTYKANLNAGSGANTGAVIMENYKYADLKGDTIIPHAYNDATKPATQTAIGREPLVQVLLVQGYGQERVIVKDAYILCRIVNKEHADTAVQTPQYNDDRDARFNWVSRVWDNCSGMTFLTPNPDDANHSSVDDFNRLVIRELLKSEYDFMTFNGIYNLDTENGKAADYVLETATGHKHPATINNIVIYKDSIEDANGNNNSKWTYEDKSSTKHQIATMTAHIAKKITNPKDYYSFGFQIDFTKDQIEALTHDQNKDVINVQFYIRWSANSTRAPYKHIYQRFNLTITRNIEVSAIKEKDANYWYALNGAENGWDAMAFNVAYPLNSTYPTDWTSSTTRAFVNNKVDFTNNQITAEKFFFVPQNTSVKAHTNTGFSEDATEWIITPASGKNDNNWNALVEKYNVKKDNHIWPLTNKADDNRVYNEASATDTAELHKIMKQCAIEYNAGAFDNVNLYAVKKADYGVAAAYTKIAELNPATGEITLVRTWTGDNVKCADKQALDEILNAFGWAADHANLTNELHAWVGYAGDNGCGVATFTFSNGGDETNKNFGIWAASWLRPINLVNDKPLDEFNAVKDAQSNGYYIPIYDLLAFYDWRGPVAGTMEGTNNKWLWAYYNINRIEVDLDPAKVQTDLNGTFGTLDKKLSEVSGTVRLYPATAAQHTALKPAAAYTFNTLIGKAGGSYNSAEVSANLVDYLEGVANGKANFGYIFYENNGVNVQKFTVRVPLTIYYEWGHLKTYTDIVINTTLFQ